jgi:hypothetical protein
MKTVILKPIEPKNEGFVIDDEFYLECAKRLNIDTNIKTIPKIFFGKDVIANIVAVFLEKYEQKNN